jgi:hypothetical protein
MAEKDHYKYGMEKDTAQRLRNDLRRANQRCGELTDDLHLQRELTGKYKALLIVAQDLLAHVETYNAQPVARSMKATDWLETIDGYFPDSQSEAEVKHR